MVKGNFWAECELLLQAEPRAIESMADAMNIDFEQLTGTNKAATGIKSRAKLLKRLKSDSTRPDRQRFFLKSAFIS
jgi:hypothetical protein